MKELNENLKNAINVIVEKLYTQTRKIQKEKNLNTGDYLKIMNYDLQVLSEKYNVEKKDLIEFFKTKIEKNLWVINFLVCMTSDDISITFYGTYHSVIKIKPYQKSNKYWFDILPVGNTKLMFSSSERWVLTYLSNKSDLYFEKIPAYLLEDFLDLLLCKKEKDSSYSKLKDMEIEFTDEAKWYAFDYGKSHFINFTKSKIEKFYKICELKVFHINYNRTQNWVGLRLPIWRNSIIENYKCDPQIDKDVDSEDNEILQFIMDNAPDYVKENKPSYASNNLYHNLVSHFESLRKSNEEILNNIIVLNKKIDNIETIIKNNKDLIICKLYSKLFNNNVNLSINEKQEKLHKYNSHSLDCGFCNYYINNMSQEFKNAYHAYEMLPYDMKENNKCRFHSDGTFYLNTPVNNQSTYLQRYEAQIICDLMKESNENLSFYCVLD